MNVTNSSSISAYYQAASIQSTQFSMSGSYLEITGGTGYTAAQDSVDLSEQAKELADRIKQLDIFKIIFPDSDARKSTKSLNEVQGDFMSDFNDFSSAFGKMSAMMGFDASQSFVMGLDGAGGMTVEGSDAGAASKLQNGFNANSTMVSRFAVMAARAALVDAGNTVDGFKDAYASDPVGAITENIDALKERLLGFRTQATDGSMNYGFMRDFNIEYSSTSVSYAAGAASETAESESAA